MPELPEVETCRLDLEKFFTGAPIALIRLFRPDIGVGEIKVNCGDGRWTGKGIERHGKTLIMALGRTDNVRPEVCYLLSRFGMSGGWKRVESRKNPSHTHLEIRFSDRSARLVWTDPRRFGRLEFSPSIKESRLLSETGPDAFSLTASDLDRLLRDSSRPLREALMDQHFIAGIGNIYMAEILFRAGISPFRTGQNLRSAERIALYLAIQSILREAILAGGSTIHSFARESGDIGRYQKKHQVYGREGHPCVRCGLPIQRLVLNARSLYYCSSCQGSGWSNRRRSSFREFLEI